MKITRTQTDSEGTFSVTCWQQQFSGRTGSSLKILGATPSVRYHHPPPEARVTQTSNTLFRACRFLLLLLLFPSICFLHTSRVKGRFLGPPTEIEAPGMESKIMRPASVGCAGYERHKVRQPYVQWCRSTSCCCWCRVLVLCRGTQYTRAGNSRIRIG